MNKTCFLIAFVLFTTLSCGLSAQKLTIQVEIDYGKGKKVTAKEISKEKNITALEALQLASTVETHAVGSHVFVTSINGVKSKRGKTAWYYKVNGKSPKVLAINNELKNEDVIRWIFKEDVCSKTVDEVK